MHRPDFSKMARLDDPYEEHLLNLPYNRPEAKKRRFHHPRVFPFALVSSVIGTGNTRTFMALCQKNGGSIFVIPYVISLVLVGFPVCYFEIILGQYGQTSPFQLWSRATPILAGLGPTFLMVQMFISASYTIAPAYSLVYLVESLRHVQPWSHCNNEFNTPLCYDSENAKTCTPGSYRYMSKCLNNTKFNTEKIQRAIRRLKPNATVRDPTDLQDFHRKYAILPALEFHRRGLLNRTESLAELGMPNPILLITLFSIWSIIFVTVGFGVRIYGKILYLVVPVSYFCLSLLLLRNLFSPRQKIAAGWHHVLEANTSKLGLAETWGSAITQVLFSLSLGEGTIIGLASYNSPKYNSYRIALLMPIVDALTSFAAAVAGSPVMASVIEELNTDQYKMKSLSQMDNMELDFVLYNHRLNLADKTEAALLGFLHYSTIVLLGLGGTMGRAFVLVAGIADYHPTLINTRLRWMATTTVVCFTSFLAGIIYTTRGGSFLLNLTGIYVTGWLLIFTTGLELMAVFLFYGAERFAKDIKIMLGMPQGKCAKAFGYPINYYYIAGWSFLAPTFLTFCVMFKATEVVTTIDPETGVHYPTWADSLGWTLTAVALSAVPVTSCFVMVKAKRTGQTFRQLLFDRRGWSLPEDMVARILDERTTEAMRLQSAKELVGFKATGLDAEKNG